MVAIGNTFAACANPSWFEFGEFHSGHVSGVQGTITVNVSSTYQQRPQKEYVFEGSK